MTRRLKIALVAGEASGDLLGSGLMRELVTARSNIEFAGIGGEHMIAQGLQLQAAMERLAVMGISEVVGRLPELLRLRRRLYRWLLNWQPDIFIGIDAPDFNLQLERKLKQAGIRTMHYVSPSVWAWRRGRIKKIRQAVDHMLTLLPFEADFYRQAAIPVTFVGHPLADATPLDYQQENYLKQLQLEQSGQRVALLPGSRAAEIARLLPLFAATMGLLTQQFPALTVLIPAVNEARQQQIADYFMAHPPAFNYRILLRQADAAIAASDVVLVASGTATLQSLLWQKPMVVAYRMSAFSYWLIAKMATTAWVSLPNILEQREWVPERLQQAATPERLVSDLVHALTHASDRAHFVQRARYWHQQLALNADQQAATAVLGLLT